MKKHDRVQITPREGALLIFLWKWKVATTAMLTRKYFPAVAPATAYRRLWRLEQGRIISSRVDRTGKKWLWSLAPRGYLAVKHSFPSLREDGFKSEHLGHDLLTSAFHLGDWFIAAPRGIKLFSEQQLRRYREEDYPQDLPRFGVHRPDGYTLVPTAGGTKVFAIEVELSQKRKLEYRYVGDFYDGTDVAQVLWLVPRRSVGESISRSLGGGKRRVHSFISYPDFLEHGWGAPIFSGVNVGQTMRGQLGGASQNILTTTSQPVVTGLTLNLAKTPHRSKSCRFFEIGDFAN